MLFTSLVIARVIAESGTPMPALEDDAVLVMKRTTVVVGDGCHGDDAGVGDGGVDAPDDGGMVDAGTIDAPDDAGPSDAGVPDAGCTTIAGPAITLVVQPRFMTDPQGLKFALLFVTPRRPIVETKSSYLFEELEYVTQPRVEYRTTYIDDPRLGTECRGYAPRSGGGCGFGGPYEPSPTWDPPTFGDGGVGDGGLVVETIGPYEILRAEPGDATELATWLTGLDYRYDQADLDAVAPYIALDYTVTAVRVAVGQPTTTTFAPIALTWPGSEIRLPAAFGTAPANVATTIYVAADGRYDIPGAAVRFAYRTAYGEGGYLTRNEVVLDSGGSPDDDPIATRVAGDPSVREVDLQEEIIRRPVNDCHDDEVGCCRDCSTGGHRVRPDMIVVVVACGYILRRRRRTRDHGEVDQPRPRR